MQKRDLYPKSKKFIFWIFIKYGVREIGVSLKIKSQTFLGCKFVLLI